MQPGPNRPHRQVGALRVKAAGHEAVQLTWKERAVEDNRFTITITTEHGDATVWWDEQGDITRWVLRYHHHAVPLHATTAREARKEALKWLGSAGVGAGEQLTSSQAARLAGIAPKTWTAYAARSKGREPSRRLVPAPDGQIGRTPWWWESTVLWWLARRPGSGRRTDVV